MNPVLLKPGSDRRSHVVLMGQPGVERVVVGLGRRAAGTGGAAHAAYDELASRYDVVVCEGAGSPAEINLRAGDYVNMGLARHAGMPTVVVGDIDRGGVFAAHVRHRRAAEPEDQALVAGFVVNKFRGDADCCGPASTSSDALTGRRVLRRAAMAPRPLAGLRGRPRPGRRRRRPAPARAGSRSCGCRGSATSPTSTRSASSPTSTSYSPPTRALSRTPTWWCCPAPARRSPTWPGCGRAAWTGGRRPCGARAAGARASAAASRCSGDTIRDPDGRRGGRRSRPRPGTARRRHGFRCRQDAAAASRERGSACPRSGYEIHHGRITRGRASRSSSAGPGPVRCSARCGTARSRVTTLRARVPARGPRARAVRRLAFRAPGSTAGPARRSRREAPRRGCAARPRRQRCHPPACPSCRPGAP